MEQRAIELINETKANFKEQDAAQINKYCVSYDLADPESLKVLESHGITIKKPSQAIVLTEEPVNLDRKIKLAEEMGFVDAYKQNPRHLSQPIEKVIKRMSMADANNISYKNEKGTYASFLFSNRAFNYIAGKSTLTEGDSPEQDLDLAEVKEDALRILETFAMEDKKDEIYARIDAIADKDLSEKEMLVEALKTLGGAESVLTETIDTILLQKEEMKRGRVA